MSEWGSQSDNVCAQERHNEEEKAIARGGYPGLIDLDLYLATPYTKYPAGIEHAFRDACRLAGALLRRGLTVYSPIVHTHPIARGADIDPLDHSIWLAFDQVRMDKADAILVAQMEGWQDSFGVQHEIDVFREAGKPVYYLDPDTMQISREPK